jgi:D-serine deaminase-like pyridoxal phosphate-dependent protein
MAAPHTLDQLETPAAVVDVPRMRQNLARTAEYCRAHGLAWRPHAKTHKSAALAAEQRAAGAMGVTVATLREAEVMAGAVDDLLVAYPPVGAARIERLLRLPDHVRVTVGLDSLEALRPLAAAAQAAGRTIGVLVEIDAGMHRVGVPDPEAAVRIASEAASLAGVEYRGVMYYPGHVRKSAGQGEAIVALAARLGEFLGALGAAGLPPRVVSGGSTPTLWNSHRATGTTEVRPGTSIFNDRNTALLGACAWDEIAYSVLATVVSTAVPGQAVVDAGSKALSREDASDGSPGLGALLDQPEVLVRSTSEEHGILDLGGTDWRPAVGDRVRIVPNHVCVSVNLQETLWGVEGDEVVAEWPVQARGRSSFTG